MRAPPFGEAPVQSTRGAPRGGKHPRPCSSIRRMAAVTSANVAFDPPLRGAVDLSDERQRQVQAVLTQPAGVSQSGLQLGDGFLQRVRQLERDKQTWHGSTSPAADGALPVPCAPVGRHRRHCPGIGNPAPDSIMPSFPRKPAKVREPAHAVVQGISTPCRRLRVRLWSPLHGFPPRLPAGMTTPKGHSRAMTGMTYSARRRPEGRVTVIPAAFSPREGGRESSSEQCISGTSIQAGHGGEATPLSRKEHRAHPRG